MQPGRSRYLFWAAVLCFSWIATASSEVKGPAASQTDRQTVLGGTAEKANDGHRTLQQPLLGTKQLISRPAKGAAVHSQSPAATSLWAACCALLQRWSTAPAWSATNTSGGSRRNQASSEPAKAAAARKLLAEQLTRSPHHSHQQVHALTGIAAVPLLAAVLLVMMVKGGPFAWLKRNKQEARDERAAATAAGTCAARDGMMVVDAAVNVSAGDSGDKGARSDSASEASSSVPARQLLAGRHGWTLSGSFTSPLVGHVGDQEIHCGVLLGSGASGSCVYKGKWDNTDVAVRVMPHEHLAPETYQQQMQQLLSLDHPNVLRTHMAVTYTRQGATTAALTGQGAADTQHGSGRKDQHAYYLPIRQPEQQASRYKASNRRASDSVAYAMSPSLAQLLQKTARTPGAVLPAGIDGEAETWLVQEYCDQGTLSTVSLEWQIAGEGDVQMLERLSLLLDVARGLKYLHSRDIVHGDLDASNVLICRSDSSPIRMTAKVADIGLCCTIKQHVSRDLPKTVRALSHVAPEQQRFGRTGPACDIYAFGIMLWEVFTGQAAYRKLLDAAHLYEAIVIQNLRPKIPPGMPADYQLLMERCWASDPADRPSVEKLIGCLSVMASERYRRLYPGEQQAPFAAPGSFPGATSGCIGPGGSRPSSMVHSSASCDQATLQFLVQQHQDRQQHPTDLQQAQQVRGQLQARCAPDSLDKDQQRCYQSGVLPTARHPSLTSRVAPGVLGAGLLHHKSCPSATLEGLLRSGSVLVNSSDSGALDSDHMDSEDMFESLQEEEAMLHQMRATSQSRSGPGSAPTMHHTQPHQRYSDGLDRFHPELEDSHMWHI